MLLESVGVAGAFALEWRDQILTMMAARTAVKDSFIDPEARLAAHVEVPDHALLAALFQTGLIFVTAALTPTLLGPGPGDFKAVALAAAFVAGEFHAFRQIDVDGDVGRQEKGSAFAPRSLGKGEAM
jgi:hypothetical protein